mmetsp:Transcript_52027/g.125559  ORF Transcript_52027/g.125559 Transcript_52027/m.125559 type:complete len:267 (+) Transcript_52027:2859-3659(+)
MFRISFPFDGWMVMAPRPPSNNTGAGRDIFAASAAAALAVSDGEEVDEGEFEDLDETLDDALMSSLLLSPFGDFSLVSSSSKSFSSEVGAVVAAGAETSVVATWDFSVVVVAAVLDSFPSSFPVAVVIVASAGTSALSMSSASNESWNLISLKLLLSPPFKLWVPFKLWLSTTSLITSWISSHPEILWNPSMRDEDDSCFSRTCSGLLLLLLVTLLLSMTTTTDLFGVSESPFSSSFLLLSPVLLLVRLGVVSDPSVEDVGLSDRC